MYSRRVERDLKIGRERDWRIRLRHKETEREREGKNWDRVAVREMKETNSWKALENG
jgi:hypothetical protein